MVIMIATILGGIGIFLIGIILMTEGLKSLGGDTLRRLLVRFTGGAVSGIASGFVLTSLVQSSNATILATIGFVSAGLIGFNQVIGIIFGANLGTTTVGWLISLLGFKLNIGLLAMPLVGIGALLMLLSRGKRTSSGMVMAGFGMLFVGIATLQGGMQHLAARVDVASFPGTDLFGRLILILIGAAMTLIMQSSSAALVTTLAALHSSAISLEQGAALVIGQSIGKTSTAIMAAIGASVQAKRAALVHILFNLVTGGMVCAIFTQFLGVVRFFCAAAGVHEPTIVLSAHYTAIYLFGIIVLYPLITPLTRLIERAIPENGSRLTKNLDTSVTNVPPVAIETARRTVIGIAAVIMESLRRILNAQASFRDVADDFDEACMALGETSRFLSHVRSQPDSSGLHGLHLSVLHSIDHLERLVETCRQVDEMDEVAHHEELRLIAIEQLSRIDMVVRWLQGHTDKAPLRVVEAMSQSIAGIRRVQRVDLLASTARGELEPEDAMSRLEAMRWLDRLAYHVWRAIYHLSKELRDQVPVPPGTSRPL
ncbi:MAG TPA: Na/Pi symporter [Spirochaetota bacterium]|nr:MAG: Na+/Pi-cotransporter [Spirochaetes bacterium ADurb.BinA120]HPI14290.1 Na/Pi symporter [Spirochaetota bacterium]